MDHIWIEFRADLDLNRSCIRCHGAVSIWLGSAPDLDLNRIRVRWTTPGLSLDGERILLWLSRRRKQGGAWGGSVSVFHTCIFEREVAATAHPLLVIPRIRNAFPHCDADSRILSQRSHHTEAPANTRQDFCSLKISLFLNIGALFVTTIPCHPRSSLSSRFGTAFHERLSLFGSSRFRMIGL